MNEPVQHIEMEELVAAYALDALDGDEVTLVEDHLAACPRCRAELAQHREVVALLAHTGAPAPEGVWDRIVGSIDDRAPDVPLAKVLDVRPRARFATRAAWVFAAAAAVALALLSAQVFRQDDRIDDLAAASADPLAQAVALTQADPDTEEVVLRSGDGGATDLQALVLVADEGPAYLLGRGLPELPRDLTYQLWGQVDDDLVSLGVLGRDPDVVPFSFDERVTALAVTEERAGGVVVTRQRPVVSGTVA